MSKKFISELNRAYKNVLMEQGPMDLPPMGGAPTPVGPPPPPAAPTPPAGPMPALPSEENPVQDKEARSSSDTFLIGLIAKSLLVNIDDDDKLKIVKFVKNLSEDNASDIEENLVNMINSYDYQNLDEDLDQHLKIPQKKARKTQKFLENILSNYIDTGVPKKNKA